MTFVTNVPCALLHSQKNASFSIATGFCLTRARDIGDKTTRRPILVVSLEEWRGLSAWDKRGPDGRLFCGICRVWIAAGGNACGVAGCPIGGDA